MIRKDISRFSHCDKKARGTRQAQMSEDERQGLTFESGVWTQALNSVFQPLRESGGRRGGKARCLHSAFWSCKSADVILFFFLNKAKVSHVRKWAFREAEKSEAVIENYTWHMQGTTASLFLFFSGVIHFVLMTPFISICSTSMDSFTRRKQIK